MPHPSDKTEIAERRDNHLANVWQRHPERAASFGGKKWWFDRWVHWWFCRRETPPKSQQPSQKFPEMSWSLWCFEKHRCWWQEPPAPASISPSPILRVFWSHSFPIPLLRFSCDDAFDGEHLVCNSFLVEKIFKTCGRTVEARNLEWLLQQLAPQNQSHKHCTSAKRVQSF